MGQLTIKQMADALSIDKQTVYRYIKKNHIHEVHQEKGMMYYDEIVLDQIKKEFEKKKSHQKITNDATFEALLNQLEKKDKQIEELQKLLNQEQQLRMAEMKKNELILEEKEKKHWWKLKK